MTHQLMGTNQGAFRDVFISDIPALKMMRITVKESMNPMIPVPSPTIIYS